MPLAALCSGLMPPKLSLGTYLGGQSEHLSAGMLGQKEAAWGVKAEFGAHIPPSLHMAADLRLLRLLLGMLRRQ